MYTFFQLVKCLIRALQMFQTFPLYHVVRNPLKAAIMHLERNTLGPGTTPVNSNTKSLFFTPLVAKLRGWKRPAVWGSEWRPWSPFIIPSGSSLRGLTSFPTHFLTYFVCLFSEGFCLLHCRLSSKLIILFKSLCNAPNPISYKNVWILIANLFSFFFFSLYFEKERKVQRFGPGEGDSGQFTGSRQRQFWPSKNAGPLKCRKQTNKQPSLALIHSFICNLCVIYTCARAHTHTHRI